MTTEFWVNLDAVKVWGLDDGDPLGNYNDGDVGLIAGFIRRYGFANAPRLWVDNKCRGGNHSVLALREVRRQGPRPEVDLCWPPRNVRVENDQWFIHWIDMSYLSETEALAYAITGFALLTFAMLTFALVDALPSAVGWTLQPAFSAILGQVPRIVLGSLLGYWAGEFTNSVILARLKVLTSGRYLWVRTIGSTIAGEAVDTAVFLAVAFAGILSSDLLLALLLSNYLFKVGVEILFTPITYAIVNVLKLAEREDYFDHDTNFSPFIWTTDHAET